MSDKEAQYKVHSFKSIFLNTLEGELLIGIGDFHGYHSALVTLLDSLNNMYQIFSNREELSLRKGVTLVFTGDYIDRGFNSLKIIEELRMLKRNNPKNVKTLIGNHELMALEDYDVAVKILEELEKPNAGYGINGFREYSEGGIHGLNGGTKFIDEFGEDQLSSFKNYVSRVGKEGDVGNWIRELMPCFKVEFAGQKILFNHADIPKNLGSESKLQEFIKQYNERIKIPSSMLGGTDKKYGDSLLKSSRSLFWSRRFSHLNKKEIEELTKELDINFLVVGHTPHKKITVYGDRIFDIDVGMTPACGKNEPAAIIFKKDGVYEFYAKRGENKIVGYERNN